MKFYALENTLIVAGRIGGRTLLVWCASARPQSGMRVFGNPHVAAAKHQTRASFYVGQSEDLLMLIAIQ